MSRRALVATQVEPLLRLLGSIMPIQSKQQLQQKLKIKKRLTQNPNGQLLPRTKATTIDRYKIQITYPTP